ncbi:3-hydroxyacyl-CoA dehydrogenase NAD-binding domain-containing protein [Falsiroseomonas sp. HW251]|uniref:3-hydroxyacyl-CoA dehydrogenase NAD-binding domain-containing protein n=1 Tax=Falsiroseomonas sp. HW251 TaxID=3390998 RepID=UPI003D31438E
MPIRNIGIVGAGTMGTGIAEVMASAGHDVVLADIDGATVARGLTTIAESLEGRLEKGRMSPVERDATLRRIRPVSGDIGLRDADLVVEAVIEDAGVKATVLRAIGDAVRPDTIIATTTSSISVTRLASVIAHRERFIGMRFFNPAPAMALVEVVRGLQTSDATHDAVEALAIKLGKVPITVRNAPGFVVNRLLFPMLNEAFVVLAAGDANPADIDDAMKLGCRHPMGPLALADLIGLDVLLSAMQSLHRELGDPKYRPAPLLAELVAAGYLGRKSGRGAYRY